MDYGFGKTYRLKDAFTALNGCVQFYEVEFNNVVLKAADPVDPANPTEQELAAIAEAQANYLRALEVLRTYGGQPIITEVNGKVLKFTLEQANVYGDAAKKQPSEKDLIADAQAKIIALFANVKAVDGTTAFTVKTATVNNVIF